MTILRAQTILHHLVENAWLDPARVVSGDTIVQIRHRRHTTFSVRHRDGTGLIVKQLRQDHPETRGGLQRELAFYQAVHAGPLTTLQPIVPELIHASPPDQLMILRRIDGRALVDGAQDQPCPPAAAAAIAQALARVHAAPLDALTLPSGAPWAFRLAAFLVAAPDAGALAAVLSARPALLTGIEEAATMWHPSAMIHGDLKWENVLLCPDRPPALIDWESTQRGDPAWDVMYFLLAGLVRVLLRRRRAGPLTMADAAHGQDSRAAFWQAWATARRLSGADLDAIRQRVVAYAAVRGVHAAYEHAADRGALLPAHVSMIDTAHLAVSAPERFAVMMGLT